MKLALISNYWKPQGPGGTEKYTKEFFQAVKEQGVEVAILFREGDGNGTGEYKLPAEKLKFASEARKILDKEKPDVILCQGGWFTEIPAIKYKKKHPEAKILVLHHSQFLDQFPLYKKILYGHILNRFDAVGFVSEGLKKDITERIGIAIGVKTFILYGGVEVEEPAEKEISEFKRKYNISPDNIYLLGLGLTALEYKSRGAQLLIDAVKELSKKYSNIRLILTRDGRFRPRLEEYAKKQGVSDKVIFTGDLPDASVAIVSSDIYTHISYGDGLPLALLEAMAFGKPIVASRIAGIPEAIKDGENGLLVENEITDVKRAIRYLVEDKSLANKLAKNAIKTAEERFRWEKTAQNFIRVVEEL